MPLRDHFTKPLNKSSSWAAMHGTWPVYIAASLRRGLLPPHYYVIPQISLGSVEVDVGTFTRDMHETSQNGGVATAVYPPPIPSVTTLVDWSELDASEVLIEEEGGRLVAAIELVSTSNKDRPATRRGFVAKCASYLYQGCSLIILDVNTDRSANLHAELLEVVAPSLAGSAGTDADRYCVSYRALPMTKRESRFDLWSFELAIGEVLPTVPLWLSPELALPLNLETSYLEACDLLQVS